MKKYLISNLVFGDLYFRIFVERHLRSILDDTNLNTIRATHEIEYRIFTDPETKIKLENHPHIKRLSALCTVDIVEFAWHQQHADGGFSKRYDLLGDCLRETIRYALNPGEGVKPFDLVTAWVADLVVARDFFPRIVKRMEEGHDAVFVLPLRSAFESTSMFFGQVNRALHDMELFKLGFMHLHPLWTACHWGNPNFSRMPYSLLWQNRNGIMARSFSVTPIIFKPTEALLQCGCIDIDVPQHFKNPYWCEDWTDAPVIGVEPLFCHHPPFQHEGCSVWLVRNWINRRQDRPINPTQKSFLKKKLFYPSRKVVKMGLLQRLKSSAVVKQILIGNSK